MNRVTQLSSTRILHQDEVKCTSLEDVAGFGSRNGGGCWHPWFAECSVKRGVGGDCESGALAESQESKQTKLNQIRFCAAKARRWVSGLLPLHNSPAPARTVSRSAITATTSLNRLVAIQFPLVFVSCNAAAGASLRLSALEPYVMGTATAIVPRMALPKLRSLGCSLYAPAATFSPLPLFFSRSVSSLQLRAQFRVLFFILDT